MIRYHFTEFERHMKLSFTLIFLSAVLLACTPSGKEKIDSGRQNPSKSPKIGFGFEASLITLYKDSDDKHHYFSKSI